MPLPRSRAIQWRLFVGAWLLAAVLAVWAAGELGRKRAAAAVERQAETSAALHVAILRSELERHSATPMVLAEDAQVRAALQAGSGSGYQALSLKLEGLAARTRAAVIYLLDARGVAVAASNWREPTSFVGTDYRFRPYFQTARAQGSGAFFALGTVSGRPGLYLARRIDSPGGPLGVVVTKVEFAALEAEWARADEPVFVTDGDGVVLITTVPSWRFHTTRPLSAERRRALAAAQTSGAPVLTDVPFEAEKGVFTTATVEGAAQLFAHGAEPLGSLDWTVHLLSPASEALSQAANQARALALLAAALLAVGSGLWLRRRHRAVDRSAEEEAARLRLEAEVENRTAELREANRRLRREMEERRQLQQSREALQNELVQSSKLGVLGQIAAGVAHEINQPLAAIRTQADSAGVYLERGEPGEVRRLLDQIAGLTDRVGRITDELRAFSRKSRGRPEPVEVDAALEGALLLIGGRLRERGVTLAREGRTGLKVRAERNRLEQVMLNLIQNALEALGDTPEPTIRLHVAEQGRQVLIRVTDNGPGLTPEMAERLFTPFATTKPDGLGLGLVISRDIVAGFGGELVHEPTAMGAAFVVSLPKSR